MSNIDEANVLLKKDIIWDEPSIKHGLSNIKKSQYTELENTLNIITAGLNKHKTDTLRNQHGVTTDKQSGYISAETVGRIESLQNLLTYYKQTAPTGLSPAGIITMFEKSPIQGNISTGWAWCNGSDTSLDLRSRSILGASTSTTYPVSKDAKLSTSGSTTLSQTYAGVTFQKRVV